MTKDAADKGLLGKFKTYSWDHDAPATYVTAGNKDTNNRPTLPDGTPESEARAAALIKKAVDSGLIVMKLPK